MEILYGIVLILLCLSVRLLHNRIDDLKKKR